MKKFLKYLQTHYLLFSFFMLYLIIPLILICAGFLCAHSLEFVSENIISVISGILAYIGTTILGMISVWQNKQAFVVNSRLMHLQRSEFEKNKSSIIRFKQDCQIQKEKLPDDIFEKNNTTAIQNYYFLSSNDYDDKNQNCDCLTLYFESMGHELNQIKISKIKVQNKKQSTMFFQTKHQFKTGFCYDFEKQAYKLMILLMDNKNMLEKYAKDQFKVVMNIELLSKANIQSNMHVTFCINDYQNTKSISDVFYYYDNDEITQNR